MLLSRRRFLFELFMREPATSWHLRLLRLITSYKLLQTAVETRLRRSERADSSRKIERVMLNFIAEITPVRRVHL